MIPFTLAESQKMTVYTARVHKARFYLLWIGIFAFVSAFSWYGEYTSSTSFGDHKHREVCQIMTYLMGTASIAFLLIWIWANWFPFPASIVAVVVFIAVLAVPIAIESPPSILNRVSLKMVIFGVLTSAVRSSYKLRSFKETMTMRST